MVTPIFFDSTFLIALHHEKDDYHERAKQVMEYVLAEHFPFCRVLTDYVFDETVTRIKDYGRNIHQAILAAKQFRDEREYHLEWVTREEFNETFKLFLSREDKRWSFTDCTSYVWMREHGIQYAVSMDSDFDQFGIVKNLARR